MSVRGEQLGDDAATQRVAIVGAGDSLGMLVIDRLIAKGPPSQTILAIDAGEFPSESRRDGVIYEALDVRSAELSERLRLHGIQSVAHLAATRSPVPRMSAHDHYSIDVDGTHNVMEASLMADVSHVVVLGSSAAYGFRADTPQPVPEDMPLRGNDAFVFARHKRLIEESLSRFRAAHPELVQLVFRAGTILGEDTADADARPFLAPVMIGVSGYETKYSLVLDADVAECIVLGIRERRHGVFNLAADGVVTARDVARLTGARYYDMPAALLAAGLALSKTCRLTSYGAEYLSFLINRPVLSNVVLKRDFGFTPTLTAQEVLDVWWRGRERRRASASDREARPGA